MKVTLRPLTAYGTRILQVFGIEWVVTEDNFHHTRVTSPGVSPVTGTNKNLWLNKSGDEDFLVTSVEEFKGVFHPKLSQTLLKPYNALPEAQVSTLGIVGSKL